MNDRYATRKSGNRPVGLICHGGAGDIAESRHQACLAGVREAGDLGRDRLFDGASALDVVETVVRALEDNIQFNAGHGSALNADGEVVTDAAIMSGPDQRAGAVGAVQGIANPVSLARRVMDDGRHVLLVGNGAEAFARRQGVPFCDPAELIVGHERERWEETHGTVGCLALDREGRLAAATSTGGVVGKYHGRLGDTPLVGSGLWADENIAVCCTGDGEAMIRTCLAHHVACRAGEFDDADEVARSAIFHMQTKTGAQGGLLTLTRDGHVAFGQNTSRMPVFGFGINGDIATI